MKGTKNLVFDNINYITDTDNSKKEHVYPCLKYTKEKNHLNKCKICKNLLSNRKLWNSHISPDTKIFCRNSFKSVPDFKL